MRVCPKCSTEKSLDCFGRNKASKDGLRCWCRPCCAEYAREWRSGAIAPRQVRTPEQRIDAIRASRRLWAANNPEHAPKYQREHRAEIKAARRTWIENNLPSIRAQACLDSGRRRARLAAAEVNDFCAEEWLAMQAMHEGRCAYCHEEKPLAMDHIVPISAGGNHTWNNIAPACKSCNSSKGNKDMLEWLTEKAA